MGYRIYLGSISNKKLKLIQNVSNEEELYKLINNITDENYDKDDCYCGVYDIVDYNLHEFGKYIEWTTELEKKFSKKVFKNKKFNKRYTQEQDFFLINKEGLIHIINDLNNDMWMYLNQLNILSEMLEILIQIDITDELKIKYNKYKTDLKQFCKYDYTSFEYDIEYLLEHEKYKSYVMTDILRKIQNNFSSTLYEHKVIPGTNQGRFYNLDEKKPLHICDSWLKDRAILELVHILKTFDFKHNKLLIYGY